jgi:Ribbon-helix-helix protein, copG family
MPTSVRLDPKTQSALDHLAARKSKTKSEIVREAIELLAEKEAQRPFDRVSDLIGCVTGGPPDLSQDAGRKFRQLLTRKHP